MNKHYRLRRREEFRHVYQRGKGTGSALMVLHTAPRRDGQIRIGFSVSKKVGNSVTRNRVKRRMREAANGYVLQLRRGQSLILVARPGMVEVDYADIVKTMLYLLRKGGCLMPAGDAATPVSIPRKNPS